MSKRTLVLSLTIALAAPAAAGHWPCEGRKPETTAQRVERAFLVGRIMPLSAYDDDPFVADAGVECLDPDAVQPTEDGRPSLKNARVGVVDEDRIYRQDPATGQFAAIAWNPWPLPLANDDGSFRFPDEERFPTFLVQRDANGMVVLRDGLQEWLPNGLHRGMNTAFEAANAVLAAAEEWAGRPVPWGWDGYLELNTHAFVDFNAFYSPSGRMLFFGVLPYRRPGETTIQMFEMATSWDVAAHESGHAIMHALKPNIVSADFGARAWGESFGDQAVMWTSVRDPGRVRALLEATGRDLASINSLAVVGEALAGILGEGYGLRNAFNDLKVSDTDEQYHDRSEVLTGAAYRLFVRVYDEKARRGPDARALADAGEVMGTFLVRVLEHTPENVMTLEDVGRAYLTVDAEHFGGRHHAFLVEEFTRREIFDETSVAEWEAHRAALPRLRLHGWSPAAVGEVVQANLEALGVGPAFGLALQSVTRDTRAQRTIVRVRLTLGRGPVATPLDNYGVLVFRTNGTLADWHPPLPPEVLGGGEAMAALDRARALGLDAHGAPLALVRGADGRLTAEARVFRGGAMNPWMQAFTEARPGGERREVVSRSYADDDRVRTVMALD